MARALLARKYTDCAITGLRTALEYRVNFFLTLAGAIAPVIIQTILWIALYGDDPSTSFFG
ncbi:MAG TPA: hypothetical protein PKH81_06420, partial [Treponemataceae bacterium]|nr:hypothetical protein [Treponemataceae bacterium]